VSVLDPDGLRVKLKLRLPLLTGWVPLKVCWSSDVAPPELPPLLPALPHAPNAKEDPAAARSKATDDPQLLIRRIATSSSPMAQDSGRM
jgi:hypothetical protein